jgi:hypothetical protein
MKDLRAYYAKRTEMIENETLAESQEWSRYLEFIKASQNEGTWKPRAKIIEVSSSKEWAHSPVKVRVPGSTGNTWIGLSCLGLRDLHGLRPKAMIGPKGVDLSGLEAGMNLQALRYDDVWYAAEVVKVSTPKMQTSAPVKVHYFGQPEEASEWLGVESLRSKTLAHAKRSLMMEREALKERADTLEKLAAQAQVQCLASDGVWYAAQVLSVSTASKRNPLKVHYMGYTEAGDEWVSLDQIRSKVLKNKGPIKS